MYRPEYPSTDLTLDHPAPVAVGEGTTTAADATPMPSSLHDVQSEPDARGIAIEQVGVSGLRYPLTFRDRATEPQ